MTIPDPFSIGTYDFELPEALIAQKPAEPRDSSRLLVIDRATGKWQHRVFHELPTFLDSRDLCVANNTRVLKARLLGRRLRFEPGKGPEGSDWLPGGNIEFVMLEQRGPKSWEGLFKASAKYLPGLRFEVPTPDGRGLRGVLIKGVKDSEHGTIVAEFDRDPLESGAGEIPLPHYIRRGDEGPGAADDSSYQTLYAKQAGSAAAPTAGLHFTREVMGGLRSRGVGWEEVTLNVGLGTFRPVKSEDIRAHKMHDERYEISEPTAARITEAKKAGKRIVAVGTTSVRTLESAWREGGGALKVGWGRTSIFIHPQEKSSLGAPAGQPHFQVVDRLLTNFHLPKSTLLMLVCAFAGTELVMEAYREAVREKYRFFSYGDAMLIL